MTTGFQREKKKTMRNPKKKRQWEIQKSRGHNRIWSSDNLDKREGITFNTKQEESE